MNGTFFLYQSKKCKGSYRSACPSWNTQPGSAGGHVIIGVAATFTELIRCPFVIHTSPLLAQACGEVGAVQIRNMGTSDGNVANTAACADSIPALVCLGVTAQIAISTMDQELPVSNLVLGPNKTCLPSEELIINFRYPIPQPGS